MEQVYKIQELMDNRSKKMEILRELQINARYQKHCDGKKFIWWTRQQNEQNWVLMSLKNSKRHCQN